MQYLAKAAVYLLLLAALLFVGLTRTDRGRQVLNTLLVDRFNARYAGTIQIDKIEGTIIGNFYARNVELLDPEGHVTARAEAIELSPRWLDLLRQKLTVRRLTLRQPVIHLIPTSSSYTILDAIQPVESSASSADWEISAAQIEIRDGAIHTIDQPRDSLETPSWLFDYANTSVHNVNLEATVEWTRTTKFIDLQNASAYTADLPMTIEEFHGQFLADSSRYALNHVTLKTSESEVRLGGYLRNSSGSSDPATDARADDAVRFNLRQSTISGRELSRIFPDLALRDSFEVAADIRGNESEYTLDRLRITSGGSVLDGTGSMTHSPDSLAFAFDAHETSLRPADMRDLWPDAPWDDYVDPGPVEGLIESRALFTSNAREQSGESVRFSSTTQMDLTGAFGDIAGEISLRSSADRPLAYDLHLTARSFDLSRIQRHPRLSGEVNGSITASGHGVSWNTLDATAGIALGRSVIAGRSIDSLAVEVAAANEQVSTQAWLYQYPNNGFLYGEAEIFNPSTDPSFGAYLSTRDLDISPLALTDTFTTRLNGSMRVQGRGALATDPLGEAVITIDSSRVYGPEDNFVIAPAVSELTLRPSSDPEPRFTLRGDLLDVTIRGDFTIRSLLSTGRMWSGAYRNAWQQIYQKPWVRPETFSGGPLPGWYNSLYQTVVGKTTEEPSHPTGSPPADLQDELGSGTRGVIDIHLRRTELLTQLLSSIPVVRGSIHTRANWEADRDSMRMDIEVTGDTLTGPRLQMRGLSAQGSIRTRQSGYLAPAATTLDIRTEIPHLELPSQTFRANRAEIHYENRRADVQLQSREIGVNSALRADLNLELLDDRNRLTLDDFRLRMRDSEWHNPGPQIIDLYQNAVVFRNVAFQNTFSGGSETDTSIQAITLEGVLSDQRADTADVHISNLHLGEFSRILALNNPIGGILSGTVALTQASGSIQTTGDVEVRDLTYDDHPLGTLQAESRYRPLQDALMLDATIAHEQPLPNGIQNHVEVSGSIGLPQQTTTDLYLDPGFLNLSVIVGEADLFFFENIFPGVVERVEATASGRGVIRGDFRRPIFEADLQIAEGSSFYQPDFNLNYQIAGPVTVDAEGFHVEDTRITDPTGGSALLSGDILFNEYEFFSFDLQAELDRLQTINVSSSRDLPFYGQIWSSGTAYLTGPLYDALLRSPNVVTTPNSRLYIPVTGVGPETDETFIVFADSTGAVPEIERPRRRKNILADRPPGERPFLDGLDMNLNIEAPRGSTVHLVFDPLLGDVVEAIGSGRIQLGINEGEFTTFGTFDITGGEYLFTAGDMFSRRFQLESGGTITWDGDPIDAQLNIPATYQTRASTAGLPGYQGSNSERIPVVIELALTGRVTSPITTVGLAIDRDEYTNTSRLTSLEPMLDDERAAEYATSVLLTNSFSLTRTNETRGLSESVDQLAFSTLSQLVANQLNRFINHALSNVDVNLGMQRGTTVQDLDVTYGVALYLLDERLIIRGRGVYETARDRSASDNLQGRLTVEVRLSPTVAMEVFYRREEGLLESAATVAPSYGAGVSYQTDFINWRQFLEERWNGWKRMWEEIVDFLGGESSSSTASSPAPRQDSTAADTVAQTSEVIRKNDQKTTNNDSDSLSGNRAPTRGNTSTSQE